MASEGDQAGRRLPEATGIEIERTQMLLEVDVKPLALRGTGFLGRNCDKRCANSSRPAMPGDHRVQDEGVSSAVPNNVDEAAQSAVIPRADPAEAVVLKSCSPVGLSDRGTEAVGVQRVERRIVEVTPPLVLDRHAPILIVRTQSGTDRHRLRGEENPLAEALKSCATSICRLSILILLWNQIRQIQAGQ